VVRGVLWGWRHNLGLQILSQDIPSISLILIHKIDNFNGSFFPIFETSPSTDIALAQACDPSVTEDDIRMAYRKAVRLEHPDTSEKPDAEDHRNTMG
jgi:hypothetical protein